MMPDEEHTYRTFCGSILSIFTVITITLYAGYKLSTMVTNADYKVQVRDQDDFYVSKDSFGAAEGF